MHHALDVRRIQAISLDLDDTLWPFAPAMRRAESVLHRWLLERVPALACAVPDPPALRSIRAGLLRARPELTLQPDRLP